MLDTPAQLALAAVSLPLLLVFSPLLLLLAPLGLALYAAWLFLGPVPPPKQRQRSAEVPDAPKAHNEGLPRRNTRWPDALVENKDGLLTVGQLMRATIRKYGEHRAVGTRRTIKTEKKEVTVKVDGKEVKKMHNIPWMTPYEWKSFSDLGNDMTSFGTGLLECTSVPLQFGDKLAMFAGTRPEWQVAAQAAFENGLVVVTVYPSLGPDALAYCLNQTEVSHLFTQASLVETVVKTMGQLKGKLRCIIYLDELTESQVQDYQKRAGVELISYNTLLQRGAEKNNSASSTLASRRQPKPDDHALIMYTSGSTGQPKGVLMSHANIVAAVAGIGLIPPKAISQEDCYIAYLPLAHVLELTAEMTILAYGGCLGYSSPTTLRDDGVCDEHGQPCGDLGLLRPTLFVAVPLILDRLRAGIQEQLAKAGPIKKAMFQLAFYLKKRRYLAGEPSPILDKLIFSKIAAKFGGRLRYILSGGAPLSPETHEFINITLCAPVLQGYGSTETMSGGTITHPDDRTTGNAGAPVACCQIKLVDVPEMGYASTDKPKPRGEIHIGGKNITLGYFQNPELTSESYYTAADGTRYFATGDVGQWQEDGTLVIIDRKKDLIKLSHGEYIAVGNLESKYAACPLVDNICVCANSFHGAPVALVVPNAEKLAAMAKEMGVAGNVEQLCKNPAIVKAVLGKLQAVAAQSKLAKWEVVAGLQLCAEPWTPQSGLLTEAHKLRRNEVNKKFKADIEKLYEQIK